MNITEELREYADRFNNSHDAWSGIGPELTAIADRIDERVTGLLREQDADLRAELDAMNDGCVQLPKDADGEYIHIGDAMEWPTTGETFEVVGIGDGTLFYIEDGSELADWTGASTKRHHHAPTVEDVLREFAQEMNENLGMYTGEAIDADEWRDADARTIAEYAAKLRLAGDDE